MEPKIGVYRPNNTYLKRQQARRRNTKIAKGLGFLVAAAVTIGAARQMPVSWIDNRLSDATWDRLYTAAELHNSAPRAQITITEGMTVDEIAGIAGAPATRRDAYAKEVAAINGREYTDGKIIINPGERLSFPDPRGYLEAKFGDQ